MSGELIQLGEAIFNEIDQNDFLNSIYDNMLYNYALDKFHLTNIRNRREYDINAALRFADLLSKSTHKTKSDQHKMWAQELVSLLLELEPENKEVKYYAGSILSSIGNYRGLELIDSPYKENTIQEKAFTAFCKQYLTIPADKSKTFFLQQKNIYDKLNGDFLSYSAPTSMGKSFIMHMFIKEHIINGAKMNFARIVPTKALINEMRTDTINDLKNILEEKNYCVVTAASDISLEEDHNFILIMTPERLLYFLISNPDFKLDYLFIDEAHKISGRNSRGPFYYKVVDLLSRKNPMPHFVFASPNIPNPEEYLKLVTEAEKGTENAVTSSYSPVTQFKFIINCEDQTISIYNDHTKSPVFVCKIKVADTSLMTYMLLMEQYDEDHIQRTLAYVNSKTSAIENARNFAQHRKNLNDPELKKLSNDIKREVHGDYFLSDIVEKGVAYHIGYLPASIRQRIEQLFKDGKITTMFCTSTLIEGVNLPADNLFIANNYNGRPKMSGVEFKNLIGRVGRIKFNLYGNVFLVTDGKRTTEKEYLELLSEPVKEQKLSIVQDLKPKLKKHIVESLLEGDAVIEKYNENQSEEEYVMMRKFGLILLQDIMDERDSLVKREFSKQLTEENINKIKQSFEKNKKYIDNDINISADQTRRLAKAIKNGCHFPEPQNGYFSHKLVYDFLNELRVIFNWDKYEYSTLGKKDKNGNYSKLSWYAVILSQWMEGHGLNYIMRRAIRYRNENPYPFYLNNYTVVTYEDTSEHRNVVFADTLEVIENVILFSISNYFLRFANMYKSIYGEHSLDTNNWYEYVEYGTTNEMTIFLQRNGFSRESANYIKEHTKDYVVVDNEENSNIKLKRSLLKCDNKNVRTEAESIIYNIPQLFLSEE